MKYGASTDDKSQLNDLPKEPGLEEVNEEEQLTWAGARNGRNSTARQHAARC